MRHIMFAIVLTHLLAASAAPAADDGPTSAELLKIDWVHPPDDPPRGVQHETLYSDAMDTEVGYNIYLPPGYAEAEDRQYPVVYFLHGSQGHESRHIRIARHLDRAIRDEQVPSMLMVFVNGGRRSGYVDSVDGTVLPATMIIEELIPHIDAAYRTVADRSGRAIEGFSMGGGGALRLALAHPDLFRFVVVYGAGGMRKIEEIPTIDAIRSPVSDRRKRRKIRMRKVHLGTGLASWREVNSYYIAERNREKIVGRVAIRQVIGTEDFSLPGAKQAQDRMHELKIPHEFQLLGGIDHNIYKLYRRVGVKGLRFHAERFGNDTDR